MHEYSIVQALMDKVMVHARTRRATSVHRLALRLGELSGVDPGLLETAWRTCRVGTICDVAELAVEIVPAEWRCPSCGRSMPKGSVLACSRCNLPATLRRGDEIVLERIEMEVIDV